jgi:outer membrane lipoprotein carrier protein
MTRGRLLTALASAAMLVGAKPSTARAQDVSVIVGRAAAVYKAIGALGADFTQVIDDPMLGQEESKGAMLQAGQAKLSMRFTDPAGDAIIADGKRVWIYTPSTTPGQVIRLQLQSGGPVYGFNLLGWLLDKPTERYTTTYVRADTVSGRAVDVVRLEPLSQDMPFTRAILWLDKDDALPRRLEVRETGGLKRTITLSNLRPNAPVSDKSFVFDVPKGVRVVDQ